MNEIEKSLIQTIKLIQDTDVDHPGDAPTLYELVGIYSNTRLGRKRKKMHYKIIDKEIQESGFNVEMKYLGNKKEKL